MAKYKVLKSVAHNLGHSFLSDMNTVDRFQSFIGQRLLEIAEEHGEPRVQLDFISEAIQPAAYRQPDIQKSAAIYNAMLRRLVEDQGSAWSMVAEARLTLEFDLKKLRLPNGSRVRRPTFNCEVEIVDDRGQSHVGRPTNWWGDPIGGLRTSSQ